MQIKKMQKMKKTDTLKTYCGICGSSTISPERESLRQLCDNCYSLLQACIEEKINSGNATESKLSDEK